MHKGGRPTPEAAGLTLEHRDAIWARLDATDEGSIFKANTLLEGLDNAALRDFHAATGYDHLHIGGGWHTAVREGAYIRRVPNPELVAQAWCTVHGWEPPIEFGDWTAWRLGLYLWEPIAGYRFRTRTPKVNTVFSVGNIRVRIASGPDWMMQEDDEGLLVRALCDMPHKTLAADLQRWILQDASQRGARLRTAKTHIEGLPDETWQRAASEGRGWRPMDVVRSLDTCLPDAARKITTP